MQHFHFGLDFSKREGKIFFKKNATTSNNKNKNTHRGMETNVLMGHMGDEQMIGGRPPEPPDLRNTKRPGRDLSHLFKRLKRMVRNPLENRGFIQVSLDGEEEDEDMF